MLLYVTILLVIFSLIAIFLPAYKLLTLETAEAAPRGDQGDRGPQGPEGAAGAAGTCELECQSLSNKNCCSYARIINPTVDEQPAYYMTNKNFDGMIIIGLLINDANGIYPGRRGWKTLLTYLPDRTLTSNALQRLIDTSAEYLRYRNNDTQQWREWYVIYQ